MTTEKYEFIKQWQPLLAIVVMAMLAIGIVLLCTYLILSFLKKQQKKRPLFGIAGALSLIVCFAIFLVNDDWKLQVSMYESFYDGEGTPISEIADQYKNAVEDYTDKITQPKQESPSEAETKSEILLDTTIIIDGTNSIDYAITLNDGKKVVIATCNFDGINLEKEFAAIGMLSFINEKTDISDYGIFVTSGEDSGLYMFMDGKLLSKTGVEKYDNVDAQAAGTKYFEELGKLMSKQLSAAASSATK